MQCGCSLKRLSREKEGRMNSLFLGTEILLIQTTSTVYVGVDSKVISIENQEVLEKLVQDRDFDVRMRVACNPMAPQHVLARLANDSSVFVR